MASPPGTAALLALVAVLAVPAPGGAAPAQPPAGEEPFADCEALVRERPGKREAYRCFYLTARRQGLWEPAASRLERILAADSERDWARLSLGNIADARGEPVAEDLFRAALEGFVAGGEPAGEVTARLNLAKFLRWHGRAEEAEGELGRAVAVAEAAGDPVLLASARIQLARHLWARNQDLGRALDLARQVEARAFPNGPYQLRLLTLHVSSSVLGETGRMSEAVAYRRRMLKLVREGGDRYVEATTLANLSMRLAEHPELAHDEGEALRLAREALAAARESGNRAIEGGARCQLGTLLPLREARGHLESCLVRARELDVASETVTALRLLAGGLAGEDPARAYRLLAEAIDLSRGTGSLWDLAASLDMLADLRWITGPREQAIADSLAALDAIEAMRRTEPGEVTRSGLLSRWTGSYYHLINHLAGSATAARPPPDDLELAFTTLERLHGQVLLTALAAAGTERRLPSSAIPPGADVRAALGADEALLAFAVGRVNPLDRPIDTVERSWLISLTRSGMSVHPVPPRSELEERVDLFAGLVGARSDAAAPTASALGRDLLGPALSALPASVDRLILVPDGALHRLPFAALRPGEDGTALVSLYEITVTPSAATWLRWRRLGVTPPEAAALVLADPQPVPSDHSVAEGGDRDGLRLRPLPAARREGRTVVRKLRRHSRLFTGEAASEWLLKSGRPRRYGLLHFAAHAVIDDHEPSRSAIVLAPGGEGEDGLLRPVEVAALALEGRAVVLAACRSARGQHLEGEGVMGLARAFFQARAHAVVGSLWPLRDDEAAALFERFYHHLAAGEGVAAALAAAQRERIREGAPTAAWAGVVVLGDGSLRPLPEGRQPRLAPLLALAAALLASLTWVLLRRRAGGSGPE